MLLILLIAVDFGRVFFTYVEINNAAREGASYAAGNPGDDPATIATIRDHATQETNAQGQAGESAITVGVACADTSGAAMDCNSAGGGAGAGNTITVTVSERFSFLTPLMNDFFGGGLDMRASTTAAALQSVASGGGTPPGPCAAPTADFNVIVTSGTTVFADPGASSPKTPPCAISGYTWTWGDGTDDVGTATGDSHPYANPGTYTIKLEVTNQGGVGTKTRQVTVPVGPPPPTCAKPNANFTWTISGNGNNRTWTYKDASTVADPANCPITDWLWTFTDDGGRQSNAPNPAAITYGNNSSHPVTLKVTNAGGSSSVTKNT